MLRDLRITNFRGLREFAMSGLGRVNLLVGTNNCGKTSVLEAIHMLSVPGTMIPLWQAQLRRGEWVDGTKERGLDVARLVHGHRLKVGIAFSIRGAHDTTAKELVTSLLERDPTVGKQLQLEQFPLPERDVAADPDLSESLWLEMEWRNEPTEEDTPRAARMPVTLREGGSIRGMFAGATDNEASFIATDGLTREDTIEMFERIVLTPEEGTVLQALRTIEPNIERIASIGTARRTSRDGRGGLVMMVAGQRIPIGSMGDGIWRLLGIALALVNVRGSVLLVDEIDTGLHYSVLVDMWRLVLETARSLDVQVFATTHSRDCYEALAAVAEPGRGEISLQRIERGKVDAVAFSELEIRQAAERGLEVR